MPAAYRTAAIEATPTKALPSRPTGETLRARFMSEIPKTYEPASIEEKWYAQWLADGCFTADPSRVSEKRPAYSIVIPPPNVTGVLTLGHVLNNTIQDILARRARMLGKEVLWLPGTDHAGIATQNVVEKTLRKAGAMKHRDDLGRDVLVGKIWEWKEKYGGIIIQQLKKLGASCDWSRERFTMDPEYSRCVSRVFVDLYKKGLIYRGKRMVNWCPVSLTALSDEEVEMKPQQGTLYYFKVEVAEQRGMALTIATTRPETIPGDTAVAVNPNDPRYAHLIGKHVIRPLPVQIPENEKLIPIVGDDSVVFDFGTGVLKVTPAHDKTDFEIGQRHGLEPVNIMNPDGTMNALAGESLAGLDRFEARAVAAERLRELGVLVKEEPYQNNVGYSERAQVPIEPRLSEQWFLKYPSVEPARACVSGRVGVPPAGLGVSPKRSSDVGEGDAKVRSGRMPDPAGETPTLPEMRFHPERWAKTYDHWMGGIQDWCISRQLWWGHRIPVWYRHAMDSAASGSGGAGNGDDSEKNEFGKASYGQNPPSDTVGVPAEAVGEGRQAVGAPPDPVGGPPDPVGGPRHLVGKTIDPIRETTEGARARGTGTVEQTDGVEVYCGLDAPEGEGWYQDSDVLDTWFSSWLWPFATMGWPEETETLKKFYPTDDLVTGPDIIFFWVARMIMAGFEWRGELPFKNVYFTGIIRDKQGRKMSKSLGNSPDPLDLIAKYGADALRFGVMRSAPLGADILFDEKNVELGRNFCTKLWNAARFRQMQTEFSGRVGVPPAGPGVSPGRTSPVEGDTAISSEDRLGETPKRSSEEIAVSPSTGEVRPGETPGPAGETPTLPETFEAEIQPALLTSDDKWILLRLDAAVRDVTLALEEYRFSDAAQALYRFFWSEYCDWYLEAAKAALGSTGGPPVPSGGPPGGSDVTGASTREALTSSTSEVSGEPPETTGQRPVLPNADAARKTNTLAVMDYVLGHLLRLMHPFLPFITEELWKGMGFADDMPAEQGGKTIMTAPWPKVLSAEERAWFGLDESDERVAAAKYEVVNLGRGLRRDFNIASNKRVRFVLRAAELSAHDRAVLALLLNAEPLDLADAAWAAPKGTPTAITPLGELFLPLEGLIDAAAERTRLTKELIKVEDELAKVRAKLANPAFAEKVPPAVLEEHRQREAAWADKHAQLQRMLAALGE
jgi:valyl-tRNA synthetase